MDTVQLTSRMTAAQADARPLVAAQRRPQEDDERRVAPRSGTPPGAVRRVVTDALESAVLNAGSTSATTGEVPKVDRVQLREDLHDFMHELHEAVKGARRDARRVAEDGTDPETESSVDGASPPRPFAEGVSALISDVSAGKVPEGLQSAFDKLLADLPGGSEKTPSLIGFLNKLQALLGYGSPAADTPTSAGNLVDLRA